MSGSGTARAPYLCLLVAVLVTSSAAPAYCRRSVQEVSEEKSYYTPSAPHSSSSPKHSSPSSPACPSPSAGGSGGGYSTPTTPSHGSGSGSYHAPPTNGGPPYTTPGTAVPSPPSTPVIAVPSPPTAYNPEVPPYHPGTCSYWSAHPEKIFVLIGHFGTVGEFFGVACVFAYGGKNPSLHDAVANTNTDGISALFREGATALLNSLSCKDFSLTKQQIRSAIVASLGNVGAAAAQAEVFKMANEGKYKR